ncbi:hypothetical protein OH76DRAFT_662187 [Lentinus brumalis]|uniref:Uncharacterized protein n=1 Tax=Lentinus brumalis TaxID=2498619 RepID=A0A371D7P6_9APHY|nr:hypothetical protein OH76DRAFT_662187 [Polyporus brumalis]
MHHEKKKKKETRHGALAVAFGVALDSTRGLSTLVRLACALACPPSALLCAPVSAVLSLRPCVCSLPCLSTVLPLPVRRASACLPPMARLLDGHQAFLPRCDLPLCAVDDFDHSRPCTLVSPVPAPYVSQLGLLPRISLLLH